MYLKELCFGLTPPGNGFTYIFLNKGIFNQLNYITRSITYFIFFTERC